VFRSVKSWFRKRDVASWRAAVAAVRREYTGAPLSEEAAGDDPLQLFERWYADAADASLFDANAFVLSTSTNGQPHGRVVLLKGFDERGFVFYTNYESDKGRQLSANPQVAITFNWPEVFRQLRIEGIVEKIPAEESDAYFNSRPSESNLGAVVSPQSREISGREELETKLQQLKNKTGSNPLRRPQNWGGYRVKPSRYEFWQGRTGRLHDRIIFESPQNGEVGWIKKRLAP